MQTAGAVAALAAGRLVVFPTESVYGLGADARSADAVDRLVSVRGREAGKPILVLIRDLAMAATITTDVSEAARRLATRFWPGPLTLVLPARDDLPPPLTAGTGTIGVRVSSHPLAAALVNGLGGPVTAPSANPPGAAPSSDIATARAYFGDAVDTYVDGGMLFGDASTVAVVEGDRVRVLRAGPVTEAALQQALIDA
ncbi:MAG TPA: L-threonylcarbamoyladenylate synthase [Candidatus Binatia bacterium]|jgi:L-threonylcarbamoyladenylate synthase|nr:L-threonylcarbamoyladenylate synthase [Candidatus Binatia bacterium]